MAQLLETMQDYTMAMLYYQELINTYPGSELEAPSKQRLSYYFDWYRDKDTYSYREEVVTYLEKGDDALSRQDFIKQFCITSKALSYVQICIFLILTSPMRITNFFNCIHATKNTKKMPFGTI